MRKKKNKIENKIEHVVFFEVEVNGVKHQEAIIYKNDDVYYADKEAGIDALVELANQKGIKSIDELKDSEYYEVLNEEELKREYPRIHTISKEMHEEENNKKEEFKDEIEEDLEDNSVLSKLNIKKLILKPAIFLLAGTLALVGGVKLGKKLIEKAKDKAPIEKETDNQVKINEEEIVNIEEKVEYKNGLDILNAYGSFDKILTDSNINKTKSNTIKNIWSYISNYNITIADIHLDEKTNTRLTHTWDEAIVNYFAYNDLSKDEVNNVFDKYNIDDATFESAYNSSIRQDILAYTVLTENTNKSDLINSKEGKDFYNKYENLLIKFNKNFDNTDSETIANELFETIRKDFDVTSDINTITSYKLSVIPIIEAFNDMTENRNFENKLTDEEMLYFDKLCDYDVIHNKIDVLSNSLYAYNIATEATEENSEELTYSQIMDAAITDLEQNEAYYVTESNRNISDHEEYKAKFSVKDEEKEEEKTKVNYNNSNTNNNDNSNYNNESDSAADNAGMVEDEEEDTIPDWMLEEEEQDTIPDWMLEEEEQEEHEDYEEDSTIISEEDQNQDDDVVAIEEDTPEIIEVEEDTQDIEEDDSVKDVTTDDTNVENSEELPDPNIVENNSVADHKKEVIADYIVNQMVDNPTSDNEVSYQFIKR